MVADRVARLDAADFWGIFQGDVIVRAAIVRGLKRLRESPWQLDLAMSSLLYDELTRDVYGEKEVLAARQWFLSTDVKVVLGRRRAGRLTFPCITCAPAQSAEAENTLADLHYQSDVPMPEGLGEIKGGPASSVIPLGRYYGDRWDASSGWLWWRLAFDTKFSPGVGMRVQGRDQTVREVVAADQGRVQLSPAGAADLREFVLLASPKVARIQIEQCANVESWEIGAHVNTEDVHLTYLATATKLLLFLYREELLEGRGFERTFVSGGRIEVTEAPGPLTIYSRYYTLQGVSRDSWAKAKQAISQSEVAMSAARAGGGSDALAEFEDQDMGPPPGAKSSGHARKR